MIEPDSYSPYQFAIKSSLDNSDISLAEKYFQSYIKKIKPINKSDYNKLIYSLFDIGKLSFFFDKLTNTAETPYLPISKTEQSSLRC